MKKMLVFFAITMFSASLFAQEAVLVKKADEIVKFKDLSYNLERLNKEYLLHMISYLLM
jgi:hypothetical protein